MIKTDLKLTSLIFLIVFFFVLNSSAQTISYNDNLNTANELYSKKKYSEAVVLFEKIYRKKKTSKIYVPYLDCLIKLSQFEQAIVIVKNYYKKSGKNPSILIDLGALYTLKGDEKLAKNKFTEAISIGLANLFKGTLFL